MKTAQWKFVYFAVGVLAGICLGAGAAIALPRIRPAERQEREPTKAGNPTEPVLIQTTAAPTPSAAPSPVPTLTQPEASTALVLRVIDGDTIEVQIGDITAPLRYIGIDSPEDGAPFSTEATESNRLLVEGKQVVLEKDASETDHYGRLLRYVYLPDGTFVNAELVRSGCASASAYPPDTRYQETFTRLEEEAKRAGLCMWGALLTTPQTAEPVRAAPIPGTPALTGQVVAFDPACSQFNAPGDDNNNKNEEYVCLRSSGDQPADLSGWSVHDEYGWSYTFPAFTLVPGASMRLRTGCGTDTPQDLYWCRSDTAIWNNGGDCAYLLDSQGTLVQQYCY